METMIEVLSPFEIALIAATLLPVQIVCLAAAIRLLAAEFCKRDANKKKHVNRYMAMKATKC